MRISRRFWSLRTSRKAPLRLILILSVFQIGSYSLLAQADLTIINFRVVDYRTGLPISDYSIKMISPLHKVTEKKSAIPKSLPFEISGGKHTFIVTANGYQTIETYFYGDEPGSINAEINMEPNGAETGFLEGKAAKAGASLGSQVILQGHVIDAETLLPLSKAMVSAGSYTTTTNGNGQFDLSVPAAQIVEGQVPKSVDIVFSKNGYESFTEQKFYLIPSNYTINTTLDPRDGKARNTNRQSENIDVRQHGMFDRTALDEARRFSDIEKNFSRESKSVNNAQLPTSIRVGLNCDCKNCQSVTVMSLEAYTQSGLDDEWIASWNFNALKAGAVAYRSYGAFYALNPVDARYDIAATTCNQVWDNSIAESAKNAAIATAGQVLLKNGAIFRSEYSAENNNAGCGDGFSGTGTAWPCISDSRCRGRATLGHGRGMCQWGSQRWSSDRDYTWILNHYYNPGGVSVSQGNDCPASLNFSATIATGVYLSSGDIVANATLANKAVVTFDAKTRVLLTPGFLADGNMGNRFAAKIKGCDTGRAIQQVERDEIMAFDESVPLSVPGIKIHPNPSSGRFTIDYGSVKENIRSISLVDRIGRTIKTISDGGTATSNLEPLIVNVEGLLPGLYYVKIVTSEQTTSLPVLLE